MSEASANPERAERILDAANRLFVRYGYDKTTVSEIANAAGVSKGAIYLHWKSKEDLFEALIFREGERLLEDMIARIEGDPDAGNVFSVYQYAILVTLDNPLMHALVTRDIRVVGDFIHRWKKSGLVEESNLFRTEFVKQLQAAGVIRADLDSDVLSYILTLIRYGFLTVHQVVPEDQTPPLKDVGKMLAQVLERGLAPEGGPDKEAGKRTLENLLQVMKGMIARLSEPRPTQTSSE
jgi:AcrR family transcriptional regulator